MEVNFGLFSLNLGKSYEDLSLMVNREKYGDAQILKKNVKAQLHEYKSWVYSCVSLISERVATVDYGFYDRRSGDEIFPNKHAYKFFSKPFRQPNELMTFGFLKAYCQIQLDLCGMSCVYPAKNKLGQVRELWPLNMNEFVDVYVSGSATNQKVKYVFRSENKEYSFDRKELIILEYPNPVNPFYPMSPIQAQAYAVDIDTYVEIYERDFFKNSARIDMALVTENDLDQDRADELRDRWRNKYTGNFHDVAVLSSGIKPVPLKFTNKDFEFLNLAQWSLNKIVSTYHVPLSKLGFREGNRAGNVMDDISFNRECIQPRLSLFDEEFTKKVLSTYDENLEFCHYNPIPRDRELEIKEARVYLGGMPAMTLNEYRKETKIGGPVEGGDRIYIPSGWVPLDRVDEFLDNNTNPRLNETDPTRHDNDEPHVNPDGMDDRDDLPTEGRNITNNENNLLKNLNKFYTIEKHLREPWFNFVFEEMKKINDTEDIKTKLSSILQGLLVTTIKTLFKTFGTEDISFEKKHWVIPTSERVSVEYVNMFFSNKEHKNFQKYIEYNFYSNNRFIKYLNTLLRASINYSKWLIMLDKNISFEWEINGNECCHSKRVKKSDLGFEIGNTVVLFPNQTLKLDCDCTIVPVKEI